MFLPTLMPQNGPYILQNPFITQNSPYMAQNSSYMPQNPLSVPRFGPHKTRSFSNLRGQENMPPLGAPFVHQKMAPSVQQTSAPFVAQNLALTTDQKRVPFVTPQLVPFLSQNAIPFVVNQAPSSPRFSPYKTRAHPHLHAQENAPLPTSFFNPPSGPLVNEHPTPFVDQKTSLFVDQDSHICVDRTARLFDDRDVSCPRSEDKVATLKSLGLGWPSSTPLGNQYSSSTSLGHSFDILGPQPRKANALESYEHPSKPHDHGHHPYKQHRKPSALHSVQAHVQQNLKPAAGRAVRYTTPAVVYAPAGAAHVPFVASTGSSWEDEAEKAMHDGAPTDDAALPTAGFDIASWSWGGPARSEGGSGIEDSGAAPGDNCIRKDNSTHKDNPSGHGPILTTHDSTTADTTTSSSERITSSSPERIAFLCYRPRWKSIQKAFKILDGLGLPIVDRSKGAARGDERTAARGDERKAARANVKMSCDDMEMVRDDMDCDDLDCDDLDCDDLDRDEIDCDGGHSDKATYNTTDAYGYAAFDPRLADLESCEAFEKDIDAALAGCANFDLAQKGVGSWEGALDVGRWEGEHSAASWEGEHSVGIWEGGSWEGEAAMSLWEDELESVWHDGEEVMRNDGEEGEEMVDGGARDDGGEREERRGQEREENGDEGGDGGEGGEGEGGAGGEGAGGEGGGGDGKNSKQGSGDQKEEDSEDQDEDHCEAEGEDHRKDQDEEDREAESEEDSSASEEDQVSAEHKTKERQPSPTTIPFTAAFHAHPPVNPSAPTTSTSTTLTSQNSGASFDAALDAWYDLDRNPEESCDARLAEWYAPLRR